MQNIKRVTSYIYTENQYFRWPPLAEAFIKHWQNLRSKGCPENMPIHWFVVTNSSDDGLGKVTYTTNKMLEKLGRQDVMPNVALTHTDRIEFLEASLGNNHAQGSASTIAKWKRELAELKESQKQRSGTRERSYTKNAEEVRGKNLSKN